MEASIARNLFNTYNESIKIIVGCLAIIASVAWQGIIISIIDGIFPLKRDQIAGKIIFAIVMTYVAVMVTLKYNRYIKDNPPVTDETKRT
jgi:hypothetical protein